MHFQKMVAQPYIEMNGSQMRRCMCGACLNRRSLELTITLEGKFGRSLRLHAARADKSVSAQ
jgi:hypothetical protein